MSDSDFSSKNTEVLLKIRKNLLSGLDEVAKSILKETFNTPGEKGAASPSQSGHLTLGLLLAVQNVLTERGYPLTW